MLVLGAFLVATHSSARVEYPFKIGVLGVLNPGIAYALGLTALTEIDASLSVIIWATEPVLIVVLAFAFLRERLPMRSVLCLASAMAGVLLIVGIPSTRESLIGVGLTFAAVLACALYSILLRRMNLIDGTLSVVFLQQASAFAFAVVVLLVVGGTTSGSISATTSQTVSAVAAGALYYGVAFLLYVAGLRRSSAARAGMFLTLIPVFGLLFSVILLGEKMDGRQLLGASVVVGSMIALALEELEWSATRRGEAEPHRPRRRSATRGF